MTCTNHPLEADQRTTLCQKKERLVRNPKHCPCSVRVRHGSYERDGPIGHVQRFDCDIPLVAFSRRHALRRYPAT
ncbi:hypothetical protein Taro_014547 [Colocasia esculenta]|uniref:Uncharacterized protein n=1 Tax=Colocasia esculenta TaxID=4460 RepID=A0A843UM55_COLES|nr:hypothetical protein [Colocasia esculenta]